MRLASYLSIAERPTSQIPAAADRSPAPWDWSESCAPLRQRHVSLSRLNHWLPRVKTHPEIMQRTADFHDEIADALLPQTDPVFDDATTLHTAVDMLDPQPTAVQRLVGELLLQGQLRTAGLLRRHEDLHLRERERQEAQILPQPTPSRERVGGGLSDAQIMHTATVGVTEKEDREEGVDQQDVFHRVVFFLAAISTRLKIF